MNVHAIRAIYFFEMSRTWRTLLQSIVSPVLSTSLYFVVFGAALGSRMTTIDGINYGAFIVPGLIMLSLLTQSISNASFGIFFPKFTGTIYEILSAPVSYIEIVIGYVGAATSKSILLGLIILITARMFVAFEIVHPLWMVAFLILTAVTFSLFGFIIGIWADGFEKLQLVPMLIVTPLTFLGGSFYSIDMLPPIWRTITLANPVVYLVSGFRWSFYGSSDVSVGVSLSMTMAFLILCLATVWWIFKQDTGSEPEEAYSLGGACTNWAEEFCSRMRLAEQGGNSTRFQPRLRAWKFQRRDVAATPRTRLSDPAAPSFLVPLVGEMRLAQIELTLDLATRLVLQLAAAEKVVGLLPLGGDQEEFDLGVKLCELFVSIIAVAAVLDML